LTVICSFNTKEFTRKIYDEIGNCEFHDLLILDNSSIKEEIPDFGNVFHISTGNVNFGGMIDWVINSEYVDKYDFIGIFNNDTFGYSCNHIKTLKNYLNNDVGIISFSISREYDKSANCMWTIPNLKSREVVFIENVSPYFNCKLLKYLRKYTPVHRHGLVDVIFSNISVKLGYKNFIIDEVSFHHLRSGCRKLVGSYDEYLRNQAHEMEKWLTNNPDLKGLSNIIH
jgi:hypothetical protein